jgi:hypothetical protein
MADFGFKSKTGKDPKNPSPPATAYELVLSRLVKSGVAVSSRVASGPVLCRRVMSGHAPKCSAIPGGVQDWPPMMRTLLNFQNRAGWTIHCLAPDCQTLVSQWVMGGYRGDPPAAPQGQRRNPGRHGRDRA